MTKHMNIETTEVRVRVQIKIYFPQYSVSVSEG